MFDEEIVLYLPWPPSVNNYYIHSRFGVRVSKKGNQYRKAVVDVLSEQICRLDLEQRINMEVILYPPDKRRRDLDNHMKALQDACTSAGLWVDDDQIDQLFIYRGEIVKKGAAVLKINEAGPILPWTTP